MTDHDDGGAAFPFTPLPQQKLPDGTWDQNDDGAEPGRSLRDWFAGHVIQGLLTNPSMISPGSLKASRHHDKIVKLAWELTDALLAERSKSDG